MSLRRGAVLALLGFAGGLWLGRELWQGPAPVAEVPAPEERRPDGSVVLERAPDRPPVRDHVLPAGATLEREVTVTIQPEAPAPRPPVPDVPRETEAVDSCPTPAPVTLRLSLVRMGDGGRRVIASAVGGTILGAVDVPVDPAPAIASRRWGVGPDYDPHTGRIGVGLDRDFDRAAFVPLPLRVGVSATPTPGGTLFGIRLRLRF